MLGGFYPVFGNVAALAAGAMMLGLAVLLLALNFSNRLHQSFALLLTLNGLYTGTVGWDKELGTVASNLRVYLVLAIPFAAAAFALRYSTTHGRFRRAWLRNVAPWAFLLGAVVAELLYMQDHTRFWTSATTGPLHLFFSVALVVFAIIALQFVGDYLAAPRGLRRRSFLLAALGFSLEPLYAGVFHALGPTGDLLWGSHHDFGHLDDPFLFWTDMLYVVPLPILVISAMLLVRRTRGSTTPDRPAEVRGFLGLWVCIAGVAVADALQLRFLGGLEGAHVHRLLYSAMLAGGTGLITYSLVKHQLFDADVRLRWALKNSSVAGAFIITFLVVSQLIQNATSQWLGVGVGALASGLLLFALTPMQRLADRITVGALPPSRPVSAMSGDERADIFREQLEIAWSDGTLSRVERLRFEKLRERLGISADAASALENEVLTGTAPTKPAGPKRGRTRTPG